MENRKRMLSWSMVPGLLLLLGLPLVGQARPAITEVINKGDEWTLNVDGEQAKMTLLGGRGSRLSDGGYAFSYEVDWGGRKGLMEARSDGDNVSQSISLRLQRANGTRIGCEGYVAQGSTQLMAGTCGGERFPGAWYAQRGGPAQVAPGLARRYEQCQERRARCAEKLASARRARDDAKQRAVAKAQSLQQCKSKLTTCRNAQASGPSTQPLSAFDRHLNGRYGLGGGGKEDSVSGREFPAAPADRDLQSWLQILRGKLGGTIHRLLPAGDRDDFSRLEKDRCGSNVYCQIGFRQQAIACSLGDC